MMWAIELKASSLDRRNLVDLLNGLGIALVEGVDCDALYSPSFDSLELSADVWAEGIKLREAFSGPGHIDSEFTIGAVIDYSKDKPIRHYFLECESGRYTVTVGTITLRTYPSPNLSSEERREWKNRNEELTYQSKLELQRQKLEPAYLNLRGSAVLKLLGQDKHTGESLYKLYETLEEHPSKRKEFQAQFGITMEQFKRFGDAVHNPVVSGDFARHAYKETPKTSNPMTMQEAQKFVVTLGMKWLSWVRAGNH